MEKELKGEGQERNRKKKKEKKRRRAKMDDEDGGGDVNKRRVRAGVGVRVVRKKKKKRNWPLSLILLQSSALSLTPRQSKIGRTVVGQIVPYSRSEARSCVAFVVLVVFVRVVGLLKYLDQSLPLSQLQDSKDDRGNRCGYAYECGRMKGQKDEEMIAVAMVSLLLWAHVRRGRGNWTKNSRPLEEQGVEGVQDVAPS